MKNINKPKKIALSLKWADPMQFFKRLLSNQIGNNIEASIKLERGASESSRLSIKIVELLLSKDRAENIIGCLVEEYGEKLASGGLYSARKWYWKQIHDLVWRVIYKAVMDRVLFRLGLWGRFAVEETVPLYLIITVIIIALYCLYIYLLFIASTFLLPIGSVAIVCVILYNYLTAVWAKLFMDKSLEASFTSEERTLRQYYFRKAYQDYKHVVEGSWKPNRAAASWIIKSGKKFFTNSAMIFTWPLGITFFTIAVVGSLVAIVTYAIFGLLHLILVIIYTVLVISLALIITGLEYVARLWQRIFLI